jgi:hypothetical protein
MVRQMQEVSAMSVYRWETTPVEMQEDFGETRHVDVAGMTVAFERFNAGADTRPLFKELPGGACQAEHWGYLIRGQFRVFTDAGEEVVRAGDAYQLAPGHNVLIEEDSELLEFTPTSARDQTIESIAAAVATG